MKKISAKKIALTGVFGALIYVVTAFVSVPAPMGNVNLGDFIILMAGWLLGPVYGAIAAGVGASLADLFAYPIYAPATLIIKAGMAVLAWFLFRLLKKKAFAGYCVSGLAAELWMVLGYFLYECILYTFGTAVIDIPFNLIQGGINLVVGVLVVLLLDKSKVKERFFLS